MPRRPHPPLLDHLLQAVPRRYRLPVAPEAPPPKTPAAALAVAIDHARLASERAQEPEDAMRQLFIDALAQLIREAMRADGGDPAYQATVLARQAPQVHEYIALQTHAEGDRRAVRAGANAVAHPARRQHGEPGPQRDALAQLHAQATAGAWSPLADTAQRLLATAQPDQGSPLQRELARLLEGAALARLQRAAVLEGDPQVQAYLALRNRQGPRPGSAEAMAYGSTAQRRGAAMEASATQALEALARRLDAAEGSAGIYRVVTSMRAPSTLPGSAERAKSEWDAVLLRQAPPRQDTPSAWDLCLLLEAKASVDAATADFSRLQRGLRLLASADEDAVYSFATHQGEVLLHGTPLRAPATLGDSGLAGMVLYCTDAPAPAVPHLLSAASRMHLMGAPPSLAFATDLAHGRQADAQNLAPLWQLLLQSPQWAPVLHQYPTLRRVRELMVHVDDLSDAVMH